MRVQADRLRDPWLIVLIGCVAGFLFLAVLVNGQRALGFDEAVTAAVTDLGIPTDIWLAITALGGSVLMPLGAIFVVALLWQRQFRLALIVAIALIGAALATDLLKDVVSRPRPPGDALAPATGYSFPSGHTLNSTVTYGLIALVLWRSELTPWIRRATTAVLLAIPFLVGLSRIALGVHYPSDVLAGWLAGVAIVAVVAVLTEPVTVDAPIAAGVAAVPQAQPGTDA